MYWEKNVIYVGKSGSGQIVKACNNMMLGVNMIGVSEAFTLASKYGISQKIFSVEYKSQADVKIFVVEYKSQADLCVYKVDYKSQAKGNEGLWYFEDYKSQADKKIYFTDYRSDSDLTIFFVDYKSQAGWQDKSKKHLLY